MVNDPRPTWPGAVLGRSRSRSLVTFVHRSEDDARLACHLNRAMGHSAVASWSAEHGAWVDTVVVPEARESESAASVPPGVSGAP